MRYAINALRACTSRPQRHVQARGTTLQQNRDSRLDGQRLERVIEIVERANHEAVHLTDHVQPPDAGALSWTTGLDAGNDHTDVRGDRRDVGAEERVTPPAERSNR